MGIYSDGLIYGASIEAVATACGLDPGEITLGLTRWSDRQYREGRMTAGEHGESIALVTR